MGVASGSVLEALESAVLFLGPLLKDLSCLPPLEIQSSPAELLRRRSSSPAVGRLRTTPSSSNSASSVSWGSCASFWCPNVVLIEEVAQMGFHEPSRRQGVHGG